MVRGAGEVVVGGAAAATAAGPGLALSPPPPPPPRAAEVPRGVGRGRRVRRERVSGASAARARRWGQNAPGRRRQRRAFPHPARIQGRSRVSGSVSRYPTPRRGATLSARGSGRGGRERCGSGSRLGPGRWPVRRREGGGACQGRGEGSWCRGQVGVR